MPNFMVIDLSHHNVSVDFATIKAAGAIGVIHKATQGTGFVDVKYAARKQAALSAGLLWGAYHFGTGDDAAQQLQHFLQTVNPDASTLVALDVETNGTNTMSLAQARGFLQGIEATLNRKAVLYCGEYVKEQLGGATDPYLGSHRLWWSQYSNEATIQTSWTNYWLWQYSDGFHGPSPHNVPGVGPCDCDTFDGTADALTASWST